MEREVSNQPKITYRSDTTGHSYQMMQQGGSFTIQVVNIDDIIIDESHPFIYLMVWRANIDSFFDVITMHINTGKWG